MGWGGFMLSRPEVSNPSQLKCEFQAPLGSGVRDAFKPRLIKFCLLLIQGKDCHSLQAGGEREFWFLLVAKVGPVSADSSGFHNGLWQWWQILKSYSIILWPISDRGSLVYHSFCLKKSILSEVVGRCYYFFGDFFSFPFFSVLWKYHINRNTGFNMHKVMKTNDARWHWRSLFFSSEFHLLEAHV